jgi:hypothetical protein
MDKEPKAIFSAPWTQGVILAMAVGFGSAVMHESPYISHRQQDDPSRFDQRFSRQDVDARLWQDPISVVERAREAEAKASGAQAGGGQKSPHSAEDLRDQIADKEAKGGVGVLAVMLRGGPHSEYVEKRRRTRYAVLAGASAMNFAPRDSDHLGWFHRPELGPRLWQGPQAVPYEWLYLAPERAATERKEGEPYIARLLVLWLDDRLFADGSPVARLDALAERLTPFDPSSKVNIPWRVIGPGRSDNLKAIVGEADRSTDRSTKSQSYSRFHFYAATATVPDEVLLEESQSQAQPCMLGTYLRNQLGIQFTRTIATDAQLVRSIVVELKLRGLRPGHLPPEEKYPEVCRAVGKGHPKAPSHIAVIGEWDTLYGRSLRRPLRATTDTPGFCVDRYSYMRGLDGALPNSKTADAGVEPPKRSGDAGQKDSDRRKDGTFIERAEGQSQFDYLRRLSKQMHERDAELRRTSKDGMGLRAIGVLGNDVNDKLLVLQALQPEFPDALFFTTDLDARYLDPREQTWTRNLIVASSFGLRLDDELQEGTPPFRDGYQTAVFFATRLLIDDATREMEDRAAKSSTAAAAMTACPGERTARWTHEMLETWLENPRIFEIGRTSAFDFKGRKPFPPPDPSLAQLLPAAYAGGSSAAAKPTARPCRGRNWLSEKCTDIHPPGSNMAPPVSLWGRWLVCALLLCLWVPFAVTSLGGVGSFIAALRPRRKLSKPARLARTATLWLLQLAVVPLALALAWPVFADWLTRGGKPLVFTEGISLWPTELIRLCVLLLGVFLLLQSWRKLATSQDSITSRFSLERERSDIEHDQAQAESHLSWSTRVANIFRLDDVAPQFLPAFRRSALPNEVSKIWQRHVVQSRPGARVVRAVTCVAVTLFLTVGITLALGEAPLALGEARFVPVRGLLSTTVHSALHVMVFLTFYMVVFFVLDAALLCTSFIHLLREQHRMWPALTLRSFEDKLGFRHDALLDHWIDLEFLAERTQAINRLIYYPFILLSLMLLSRSSAFDDWTMPLSGKVLAVLGALIALCGPVALRTAVERSRTAALRDLDMALIQASSLKPQPAATATDGFGPPCLHQLELLRERIIRLNDGAFAPYSQQPLLKALVLPFITVGGTSLLELLRMANI